MPHYMQSRLAVFLCLALSTRSQLHQNEALASPSMEHVEYGRVSAVSAKICLFNCRCSCIQLPPEAISRYTQIKFCVSPESTYIFYFPAHLEETVCFYWAGITLAEPWGDGSFVSGKLFCVC